MHVSKHVDIDITKETVVRTGVVKHLTIAGVMLLGLFPIVELTRFILTYMNEAGKEGYYIFPAITPTYILELATMWFLYLLIPVVLYFYLRSR